MADWRPYLFLGRKSLTASSSGSITFTVGAGEEFAGHEIRIKATSESFDITKISDQGGVPYTNATASDPIDGKLVTNDTENNYNVVRLPIELNLPPNSVLTFELKDTSGNTNEVFILLAGKMRSV